MNEFIINENIPVRLEDGKAADARTGRRLVYDNKTGKYIVPSKKTKVNTTLWRGVYADVHKLEHDCLYYYVLKADRITGDGLIFQHKYVFSARVSREGKLVTESGEKDLAYWLSDPDRRLKRDLLSPVNKEDCSCDSVCRRLFGWSAKHVVGDVADDSVYTILRMAEDGAMETRIAELNDFTTQEFGVELEFTGMRIDKAAYIISKMLYSEQSPSVLDRLYYEVIDSRGATWKIIVDRSIEGQCETGKTDLDAYKCELITPVLSYSDIYVIQTMIRVLKRYGAVVNESCGLHVHVDDTGHSPDSLRRLSNFVASNEDLLFRILEVDHHREKYCEKTDKTYLSRLNGIPEEALTLRIIRSAWYNGGARTLNHFDDSRYHALNLHSLFERKGIEFRLFNSTLDEDRVKAHITLCLALCHYPKWHRDTYCTDVRQDDYHAINRFLDEMGMIGEEFKESKRLIVSELSRSHRWKNEDCETVSANNA